MRERAGVEAQLRLAQKLESIGQLAAGIAHEINTPVQYVSDNLSFMATSWQDMQPLIDDYSESLKARRSPAPARAGARSGTRRTWISFARSCRLRSKQPNTGLKHDQPHRARDEGIFASRQRRLQPADIIAAAVCRICSLSAPAPAINAMRSSPGGARCVWFQLSSTAAGSHPQASAMRSITRSDAGACSPMMSTPQSTTRVSPCSSTTAPVSSGQPVPARDVDLPDEAEHRQAERRVERKGGGSGAHQYIRKPPLTLIVAPEM